jgi:soluble lytic murein transglycosylase-like protein
VTFWSLALLAALSIGRAVASAQTELYELAPQQGGGLAAFTHNAFDAPPGAKPVSFPARAARTYQRPPRGTTLQRLRRLLPYLLEAAALYQLPASYLCAVAQVESRFDPYVVSVDGAAGVMQLMPFTARKMGVLNPFDARQSVLGGARFLRVLANQWNGDLERTTAAYNAGSGAVTKYGGVPPYTETQRYVRKVLRLYRAYRDAPPAAAPRTEGRTHG